MGRKSKEIVKAKLEDVIADLNKAYADEWLAHYQYWLNAQWIRGNGCGYSERHTGSTI